MILRVVRTALMTLIMCGIMTFLVTIINLGFHAGMVFPWLRNWAVAMIALFPMAFFVTPGVGKMLGKAGLKGQGFRLGCAAVLAVIYALWMTFVMSALQMGFTAGLTAAWMRAFRILVGIAFVLLYLLTPAVSRMAERICGGAAEIH